MIWLMIDLDTQTHAANIAKTPKIVGASSVANLEVLYVSKDEGIDWAKINRESFKEHLC